jgi:hypothetical protein
MGVLHISLSFLLRRKTMYPNLIQPFVDWTNANVETFTRLAKSPELAEVTRKNVDSFWRVAQENLTRVAQSDAFAEWTKANVDNFSRLTQEYSRNLYTAASEAQAEITRELQEGTRRLQQVANLSSNIIGFSAEETAKTVGASVEEGAEEIEERARATRRRG